MKERIESLDSLRGVSALAVVIFHCLISFDIFYNAGIKHSYANEAVKIFTLSPLQTFWAGREAVILFFVLSGFVLAIPFLSNRITNYRNYVIKRFFRIYIPYITVMIISVVFVNFFEVFKDGIVLSPAYSERWEHQVSLVAVVSYFLMLPYDITNVNGVVWSLYHEMRISLFFPLIMFIIIKFNWKKSILICFIALMSLISSLDQLSYLMGEGNLAKVISNFGDTFYYASFFVIGALLSKYRKLITDELKKTSKGIKCFLFLCSLLLINCRWIFYFFDLNSSSFLKDFIPAIGIAILFMVVLSSVLADKILTTKPLLFLGKISYSLYLIHVIVIMILSIFLSKLIPMEIALMLSPVVSIPVAYVVYKYIEMPAIQWGKKVIKLLDRKQSAEFIYSK